MGPAIKFTRIFFLFICAISIIGCLYFSHKAQWPLVMSLIPLVSWTYIISRNPGALPFFSRDSKVLRFSTTTFSALSIFFLAMCLWVTYLQWPRVFGPRYNGTVVGFDGSHPNAINYAFPIVEFTDSNGERIKFSNFDESQRDFKKASKMPISMVGEQVEVFRDNGRYFADIRGEAKIFWTLFGMMAFAFFFTAGVTVISHTRQSSLKAASD